MILGDTAYLADLISGTDDDLSYMLSVYVREAHRHARA